jgi:hypothetical protein
MDSEIISKRLHVSGLTPAITPEDLARRLNSFGTVKALDGFGKLDGVGQPRKFGYVTLEGTRPQLQKCASLSGPRDNYVDDVPGMNVLSGAIWKGTKLRVGEAKPDYQER